MNAHNVRRFGISALPAFAATVGVVVVSAMSPQPDPDAVVAAVGSRKIVAADVLERVTAQRLKDISRNRLDSLLPSARDKALAELIDLRLFSIAARSQGLDRRPDVARRLENLVDESLAQFEIADIVERRPVDDAALRAYFDAHPDEFRAPDEVHARHILVGTREEARSILATLEAGAVFADLARQHNIDSTKATGGDLGMVRRGVMVPDFEKALFALKVGEISPIVQTSHGFHIVTAEEIRAGKLPAYDAVKQTVRQKALQARVADVKEELIHEYPVHVDKLILAAIGK